MTKQQLKYYFLIPIVSVFITCMPSCKNRKKMQKSENTQVASDTTNIKCRLDFKNAKALSKYVKENEFTYTWISAKANVESNIDGKEESFDIRLKIRKDSAILISIQYLLGLQVAKVLIRKDSVFLVDYIHKNYFKGDFNYLNELLNADLSTERKRRLRRIQHGESEVKKALQTLTLNPDNFKIIKNEFIDPATNRTFTANYRDFTQKDSVYAPYLVDIDIVAEKKAKLKIEYVRIEKNTAQKLDLNIPAKYDPIEIQKKPK
ncbi:MAG: hypothetical protein K0S12_727 [Bacteroidetes bacterium]|nr:hypothetical protein [Bacteroidota bacterium]